MVVIHWNSGSSTQVGLMPGLEQLSELTSPALRDSDPLYCLPVILHQPPHRASENTFSFNPLETARPRGYIHVTEQRPRNANPGLSLSQVCILRVETRHQDNEMQRRSGLGPKLLFDLASYSWGGVFKYAAL